MARRRPNAEASVLRFHLPRQCHPSRLFRRSNSQKVVGVWPPRTMPSVPWLRRNLIKRMLSDWPPPNADRPVVAAESDKKVIAGWPPPQRLPPNRLKGTSSSSAQAAATSVDPSMKRLAFLRSHRPTPSIHHQAIACPLLGQSEAVAIRSPGIGRIGL